MRDDDDDTLNARLLLGLDGVPVGLLSPDEMVAFDHLCRVGRASRSFEGPLGFLGCSRVRITREEQ